MTTTSGETRAQSQLDPPLVGSYETGRELIQHKQINYHVGVAWKEYGRDGSIGMVKDVNYRLSVDYILIILRFSLQHNT